MKLVKEESVKQAEKNVREAVLNISDDGERAAVIVALMQFQDALNADLKKEGGQK